jgi:hypothetical protein
VQDEQMQRVKSNELLKRNIIYQKRFVMGAIKGLFWSEKISHFNFNCQSVIHVAFSTK